MLFRMNGVKELAVLNEEDEDKENKGVVNWKTVLLEKEAGKNWSFVEEADLVINNRYMTGDYAKLEQALVYFTHDMLEYLNNLQNKGKLKIRYFFIFTLIDYTFILY